MRFGERYRIKGARRLGGRLALVTLALAVAFAMVAGDAAARKKKPKGPPGTIIFERKAKSADEQYPPAYFPHWVHEVRYRCYVCHPAIFVMKAGANATTKDAMRKGKSCGKCHNGRYAFPIALQTCPRCHRKVK